MERSLARTYWLQTLSPTHVGTGRGLGYIDLPIHRDPVTHWPIIPGSAFKGVWSDYYRATEDNRKSNRSLGLAFGRASDNEPNQSNAGALVPTDARLVCLPIRSFQGTFAWCTSSMLLRMLDRDLQLVGEMGLKGRLPKAPAIESPNDGSAQIGVTSSSALKDQEQHVYLEDLDFMVQGDANIDRCAKTLAGWIFPDDEGWQQTFVERFAVVPDTIFDFLAETGTEVTTRVRIDDDLKTVARGQLWSEEALPAQTILAGLIACDRVYSKNSGKNGQEPGESITESSLVESYATAPLNLQIGGKATVGRGRVRCTFNPIAPANPEQGRSSQNGAS